MRKVPGEAASVPEPNVLNTQLSSVANSQELAQTVEASSTVRGVELPPTLQIIDKQ